MIKFIKPKKKIKEKQNSTISDYVSYSKLQGGFEVRINRISNSLPEKFIWVMTGIFGLNHIVEETGTSRSIDDAIKAAEKRYMAMKKKGQY
jgi:hypothetical protein